MLDFQPKTHQSWVVLNNFWAQKLPSVGLKLFIYTKNERFSTTYDLYKSKLQQKSLKYFSKNVREICNPKSIHFELFRVILGSKTADFWARNL